MLQPDDATDRKHPQEYIPPGARSPHPYRRQSINIPDSVFKTNLAAKERHSYIAAQQPLQIPRIVRNDSDLSDYFTRESRRPTTTSPSDSGTEADDEKPYLKGLPPARGKIRKGLKGTSGVATPSEFDGVQELLLAESQAIPDHGFEKPTKTAVTFPDGQIGKYVSKWRSELFRRVLEVAFVCGLTRSILTIEVGRYGDKIVLEEEQADVAVLRRAARLCELFLAYYLLYVIWLLQRHVRAAWSGNRDKLRQVPAPFDPAFALYPFLIPVAIAACTTTFWGIRASVMRVSMALGVTSWWPSSQKLAFLCRQHGTEVLWMASVGLAVGVPVGTRVPGSVSPKQTDDLMILVPLLCVLSPTIQYFCGTSLLPAETQLLSIGLINLLLFASAPQAMILYSLMWIGGVGLLISCRHVMKWSTMLARIPGWRFRSPRHANATLQNKKESGAIATILQASSFLPEAQRGDSSDENDCVIDGSGQAPSSAGPVTGERTSAFLYRLPGGKSIQRFGIKDLQSLKANGRRHTVPVRGTVQVEARPEDVRKSKNSKRRPFLWLTRTQAQILKWLYAAYCYTMTVGIIFIPVRWYIQKHAFNGIEPVGWAIGYLFGNLQPLRLQVILTELDTWIVLPPRLEPYRPLSYSFNDTLEDHRMYTIGAANTRLAIAAWCVLNLLVGIGAVLQLKAFVEVDTRRKVFHGMMVSMFLPTIFVDPCFVALALALMLVIFLVLDLFRATQLPPISRPLTHFLAPYVDGRDHKGPIIISPIFLLIGCAIPLWLSLASMERGSLARISSSHPWYQWELPRRDVSMVAGVICVGMGDAAASLIGRRYGRRRWIWSGGKSLEGSAAFVVAVVIGLSAAEIWRRMGGWPSENAFRQHGPTGDMKHDGVLLFIGKSTLAGAGASFTEAVLTGGNDNVIVPVVLWLLVRVLKI